MTNKLVIYHSGCRDGFAAAWVAWNHGWRDAEFYPAAHGTDPPDVVGKDVLMLDFTYRTREVMDQMAASAKTFLVLDHHKTAEEVLRGAPYAVFDMERSGAGLAWDELTRTTHDIRPVGLLFRTPKRPWLVDYVEDRDLWLFKLPDSRKINAYIGVLPFEFDKWDEANRLDIDWAIEFGSVALAKTDQYVAEVAKQSYSTLFHNLRGRAVNAPYCDISEVLHAMLLMPGVELAIGWSRRADGSFTYSLRSTTVDVSEIAKVYGGGGHKNAAGFQTAEMLAL